MTFSPLCSYRNFTKVTTFGLTSHVGLTRGPGIVRRTLCLLPGCSIASRESRTRVKIGVPTKRTFAPYVMFKQPNEGHTNPPVVLIPMQIYADLPF